MRALAFMIHKIEEEGNFYKFDLTGYSGEHEYDLYFLIQKDLPAGSMETGNYFFHENSIKFIKKSDLGNHIIPVLCDKLEIDIKEISSQTLKDEVEIFNMAPLDGDFSKLTSNNVRMKGFMGDGSIEFYIGIQPKDQVLLVDVRDGSEEGFIDFLAS